MGQFSLDISYFGDSLLFDEVSDSFITFFLKELLESVRAKIIEKLSNVLSFGCCIQSRDMKVDSNVDADSNIVLSGYIGNRTFVSDRIL